MLEPRQLEQREVHHHDARATSKSTGSTTTTTTATDLAAVNIKLTKLAELQRPTAMAVRPGDATTLYVVEKVGRIRRIRDGKLDAAPWLDITSLVGSSSNEQGLLGLAFSPDASKLYVDYTKKNGDTRVDEYAVGTTGAVDVASRRQVLAQPQPEVNHNGGQLGFGPDGLLYIGLGDGGAAGDQGPGHVAGGNGQSLGTLLGKILRINPTPSAGQAYTIPPDNPFVGKAGARPRSGPTACATRGASPGTRRPATSGSATSARTCGRRSISRPRRPAPAAGSTTDGTCGREPTATATAMPPKR